MCTAFAVRDLVSHKMIYLMANVFPCSLPGVVHGSNRVANALDHILHKDAGARPSNCIDECTLVGLKAINQQEQTAMQLQLPFMVLQGIQLAQANAQLNSHTKLRTMRTSQRRRRSRMTSIRKLLSQTRSQQHNKVRKLPQARINQQFRHCVTSRQESSNGYENEKDHNNHQHIYQSDWDNNNQFRFQPKPPGGQFA